MKVVELRKGEGEETQEDDPGLPAVELVLAVDDCSYEKFDSGLGN